MLKRMGGNVPPNNQGLLTRFYNQDDDGDTLELPSLSEL